MDQQTEELLHEAARGCCSNLSLLIGNRLDEPTFPSVMLQLVCLAHAGGLLE